MASPDKHKPDKDRKRCVLCGNAWPCPMHRQFPDATQLMEEAAAEEPDHIYRGKYVGP